MAASCDDGEAGPDAALRDSSIRIIILRPEAGVADAAADASVPSDGGRDAAPASDAAASDAAMPVDAAMSSDASAQDAGSPLVCGTTTCAPLQMIPNGPTVTPCCYQGGGPSVCSGRIPNGPCNRPAVPDNECDDITVLSILRQGCCASNDRCGLDGNSAGVGCQALEDVESFFGIDIPQSAMRPCN